MFLFLKRACGDEWGTEKNYIKREKLIKLEEHERAAEREKERVSNIDLCWIPRHTDIAGNKKLDAAKNADRSTHIKAIHHTGMTREIKNAVWERWQNLWVSLNHQGRKLKEVKEVVSVWNSSYKKNRKIETFLSRLRIRHTNIQ